jgi:hypothetical protein
LTENGRREFSACARSDGSCPLYRTLHSCSSSGRDCIVNC